MTTISRTPLLLEDLGTAEQQPTLEGASERQIRAVRALSLPDPTGICCSVAQAAVEAIFGTRPVQQLTRMVSPEVYAQLSARAFAQQTIDRANGVSRNSPNPALRQRTAKSGVTSSGNAPVRIVRARVLRLNSIAAEATVVIHDGHKVRATALRVEEFRGRWRVNVLNIG